LREGMLATMMAADGFRTLPPQPGGRRPRR
jgi:hypothetical protein